MTILSINPNRFFVMNHKKTYFCVFFLAKYLFISIINVIFANGNVEPVLKGSQYSCL